MTRTFSSSIKSWVQFLQQSTSLRAKRDPQFQRKLGIFLTDRDLSNQRRLHVFGLSSDWLIVLFTSLLWFWFSNTQMKTALSFHIGLLWYSSQRVFTWLILCSVLFSGHRTLFDVLKDENNFSEIYEKRKNRLTTGEKSPAGKKVTTKTKIEELNQENKAWNWLVFFYSPQQLRVLSILILRLNYFGQNPMRLWLTLLYFGLSAWKRSVQIPDEETGHFPFCSYNENKCIKRKNRENLC